jgi:hypothetical protein
MLQPAFQPEELTDSLFEFPQGMNAGIAPATLPKSQLAFLTNGTVRGDFPTHRPTFRKIAVLFSNPADLTAFQTGKFQGAAVFNPIAAQDCIAVSISGKIYELVPGQITAAGINVTPNDGGNPSTPDQVWMFQTERWLVVNDGQSIPIFLDGQTSRRSITGGYEVTLTNVSDPNHLTVYPVGTTAQFKSSQTFCVLYTGFSCPPPSAGGFGAPGTTPKITPPPPPPSTAPAPTPPPPPATPPPPTTTAHWPWLPDNTNNWIPPTP